MSIKVGRDCKPAVGASPGGVTPGYHILIRKLFHLDGCAGLRARRCFHLLQVSELTWYMESGTIGFFKTQGIITDQQSHDVGCALSHLV